MLFVSIYLSDFNENTTAFSDPNSACTAALVPVLLNVKSCRPYTWLGVKEGTCLPFTWLQYKEGRVCSLSWLRYKEGTCLLFTRIRYKEGRVCSLHG